MKSGHGQAHKTRRGMVPQISSKYLCSNDELPVHSSDTTLLSDLLAQFHIFFELSFTSFTDTMSGFQPQA